MICQPLCQAVMSKIIHSPSSNLLLLEETISMESYVVIRRLRT